MKKKIIPFVLLLIPTALLQLSARFLPGFGEWYAESIYRALVGVFGRLCSAVPFSMAEFALYFGIFLFFGGGIAGLIFGKRNFIKKWFYTIGITLSFLAFTYTLGCGINYYRTPFSEKEDYVHENYTGEELKELCCYLQKELNQTAELVSLDEQGHMDLDLKAAGAEAKSAMESLGNRYPSLKGYYPRPKYLWNSGILSIQQVMGIYSPFTIEANVNQEMPFSNIPVTLTHELSHLRGFMREEEANFIAYLACRNSELPEFHYSGLLLAYSYSMNALYRSGETEAYFNIQAELSERVKAEYAYDSLFWAEYDTKVAEAASKMNDAYLKANSQQDGVRSYGRMVDLLLVHYLKEVRE